MATEYELNQKKKKYRTLRGNVKSIIDKLDIAVEALEIPANRIKDSYNIDSNSVDEEVISSIRDNLISRKNYLKNTIIYNIDVKINDINDELESMGEGLWVVWLLILQN